jgi:hypothetical protein
MQYSGGNVILDAGRLDTQPRLADGLNSDESKPAVALSNAHNRFLRGPKERAIDPPGLGESVLIRTGIYFGAYVLNGDLGGRLRRTTEAY